jgi:hypothetical protein
MNIKLTTIVSLLFLTIFVENHVSLMPTVLEQEDLLNLISLIKRHQNNPLPERKASRTEDSYKYSRKMKGNFGRKKYPIIRKG